MGYFISFAGFMKKCLESWIWNFDYVYFTVPLKSNMIFRGFAMSDVHDLLYYIIIHIVWIIFFKSSQVTFIYIALLTITNCVKVTTQYQNRKIVC